MASKIKGNWVDLVALVSSIAESHVYEIDTCLLNVCQKSVHFWNDQCLTEMDWFAGVEMHSILQ